MDKQAARRWRAHCWLAYGLRVTHPDRPWLASEWPGLLERLRLASRPLGLLTACNLPLEVLVDSESV